jgi:hypothetical protein
MYNHRKKTFICVSFQVCPDFCSTLCMCVCVCGDQWQACIMWAVKSFVISKIQILIVEMNLEQFKVLILITLNKQ